MAAAAPVFGWSGNAMIVGTTSQRKFTLREFRQVQEAWAVRDSDFDHLLDVYRDTVRKTKVKPTLKQWKITGRVLRQGAGYDPVRMHQIQRMSRRCKVHFIFT